DFALRQNFFRDDRRDVLASTRAALDYLGKLYGMFGDWHLALAAYNWGEGSVARAIARNQRAGLPTDYASLRMPNETAYYVPKLQAVKNIVAHPESYSLTLPTLSNHPYFVGVPITRDIDVDLAARLAGISVEDFKNLNPQMNKPVILAAGTPQVLLPYDNADNFVRELNGHRGAMASWTAWVAPKTLRPADAARQVGMSEAQLREVNHIPPHMLVKAGSTLLVPRNAQRHTDVSEHLADNAMMALTPEQAAQRRLALKAGKKDSVASVAKRYRVSNAQVAQWNQVGTGASFKPGQTIVVYVAAHAKPVRVAARKHGTRTVGGGTIARVSLKPAKTTARATARE
ncbi:MAG TPA: LysM peptidoglycan-binding domain-containing protein, partial [Albitalea sp.]|nr:LysM peptidoglycan-binding domain-containing protein [Albitalea sp.]